MFIWDDFLNIIKQEAGTQVVETWFKAVKFERWDKETNTIFLLMPNPFVRKWIQEHYTTLIKTHLSRLLHTNEIKLFFFCKEEDQSSSKKIIPASPLQKQVLADFYRPEPSTKILPATYIKNELIGKPQRRYSTDQLNPKFTFNSLVVGPSNSLAHAAAIAVSENLGKIYNPLFIYGKTGLGKTHLLHAIGNEIKQKYNNCVILYKTSDNFMSEYIDSIKGDKIRQFREKYQRADLLLLDDIQFFSNKEQTQETFFHIFDNLFSKNKQVIFSSDTFPKDISGLQNRLKSRLQCGLVTDIQIPTTEMKIAILKKKMALQSIDIDDEVIKFISSLEINSIRELEGYYIRLSAFASLTGEKITLEIANNILFQGEKFPDNKNNSLNSILKTIAKHCSVSIDEIKSKKRDKNIVMARQIAFYVLKKTTSYSFQAIGSMIGGRNHTTVMHAFNKIDSLKEQDYQVAPILKIIKKEFTI